MDEPRVVQHHDRGRQQGAVLAPVGDARGEQAEREDHRSKDDAVGGAWGRRAPEKHGQRDGAREKGCRGSDDGCLVHVLVCPSGMRVPPLVPGASCVQDDARLHQNEGAGNHCGHGCKGAEGVVWCEQECNPDHEEGEELPRLVVASCTQCATAERKDQEHQEDHHCGGQSTESHLIRETKTLVHMTSARTDAEIAVPKKSKPVASRLDPTQR
mmetsp:Transcript_89334/g.282666  ORF Transcript_89334/g.282666 Transcript_89334/m.282666 type:complete len:213 (+) Transcript_89334:769-1407(+)